MYYIIEIQESAEGVGSVLPQTRDTLNEAESVYHGILQYAAVSSLPYHGAIILTEDCKPVMNRCYAHESPQE